MDQEGVSDVHKTEITRSQRSLPRKIGASRNNARKKMDKIQTSKPSKKDGKTICVNKAVPSTLFPAVKGSKPKRIVHGELINLLNKIKETDNSEVEETVEEKMDEIFEKLKKSQIILIQGNTGCGKTTKIPKYLLKEYKRIICSQPRRIAAISVAKKVASDMNVKVGEEVGYAVRFDDLSSRRTRLKYVTDGILMREINFDKHLNNYDVVIIDEAHERTINIDVLLAYLKDISTKRRDLKIIIMSATLSAEKFISFFGCEMVDIRHRAFPLEIFFLKQASEKYLSETIKTIFQIHKSEGDGDILVFLTGKEEINKASEFLSGALDAKEVEICSIYSTLPPEQQELVFKPSKKRKIVIATNIAETSITIENVKFVVDCGKVKQMRYSSVLGMDILEVVWISKAQAKQRAGRAGRTQAGKVFRIYTKEDFNRMEQHSVPEILCGNISNVVLLLKSIGVNDIVNFDLIDKPDINNVKKALELLYYLKTIESNGDITAMGIKVSRIPVEPQLAVSLIASSELGCLDDVSTIAAMLSVEHIWLDIPKHSELYPEFSMVRASYFDERGDYFSLLHIYRDWKEAKFGIPYLKKKYLNVKMMLQASKVKKQLCSMFDQPYRSDYSKIVLSFCAGYFMNVAKLTENGYVSIFYDTPCYIHRSSCLFKRNARYILYHNICRTGKEYIKFCLEVTQDDLLKGANHVFLEEEK